MSLRAMHLLLQPILERVRCKRDRSSPKDPNRPEPLSPMIERRYRENQYANQTSDDRASMLDITAVQSVHAARLERSCELKDRDRMNR